MYTMELPRLCQFWVPRGKNSNFVLLGKDSIPFACDNYNIKIYDSLTKSFLSSEFHSLASSFHFL